MPTVGEEAQFITEHYWGYTRQRDGSTIEYEVRHPSWRVWSAEHADLRVEVATLYGPEFVQALAGPPRSAFVAEGSPVSPKSRAKVVVDVPNILTEGLTTG